MTETIHTGIVCLSALIISGVLLVGFRDWLALRRSETVSRETAAELQKSIDGLARRVEAQEFRSGMGKRPA